MMETPTKKQSQGCFLKIDSIWSEYGGTYENFSVKEEVIPELETDPLLTTDPLQVDENVSQTVNTVDKSVVPKVNNVLKSNIMEDSRRRSKRDRGQKAEVENVMNVPICCHDPDNFKIVKKKLRCGDCNSLVCPECCKVPIMNLHNHFAGADLKTPINNICRLCYSVFSSQCSLQAHLRIHAVNMPYVCPDCGLIYNNIYYLILHLLNKCYHFYKVGRYKCKNCPDTYFLYEEFVDHIKDVHSEVIVKCSHCNNFFKGAEELKNHLEELNLQKKVQFHNYYRCKMCTNVPLTRMYQKHIDYHRDCTSTTDISYLCICGIFLNSIPAFRSHIQICNKKGVLPPYWSFLNKKLVRLCELVRFENHMGRKPELVSCKSGISFESRIEKVNKVIEHGEGENETNKNSEKNVTKEISEVVKLKDSGKVSEVKENTKAKTDTQSTHEIDNKKPSESNQSGSSDMLKSLNNITDSSKVRGKKDGEVNKSSMKQNESEGISKIYDHIPCDHLGYVKTRPIQPPPTPPLPTPPPPPIPPKQKPENETQVTEKNSVDVEKEDFCIVTELDEKTGFMVSRKVPSIVIDDDKDDENDKSITNDKGDSSDTYEIIQIDEDDTEDNSDIFTAKNKANERPVYRPNIMAYLSCPFCTKIFQKKTSTFQDFATHLSTQHPEAALNITIMPDDETSNVNESTPTDPYHSEKQLINEIPQNNVKLSPRDQKSSTIQKKETLNKKKLETDSSKVKTTEKNVDDDEPIVVNTNESVDKQKLKIESDKQKKESLSTKDNADDLFLSLKLSLEKKGVICEKKPATNPSPNSKELDKKCEPIVEVHKTSNVEVKQRKSFPLDRLECKKIMSNQNLLSLSSNKASSSNVKNDKSQTILNDLENSILENNPEITIKRRRDSDYKGNGELSEGNKDIPHCSEESTSHFNPEVTFNNDTTESSDYKETKRESEVWSELYESLKRAEKGKKRRKPNMSEKDKKSLMSEYSTKRIVKKPKRYRQSSESEESYAFEESDSDNVSRNDSSGEIGESETAKPDTFIDKKQRLLNKLEHVDQDFVDYLFNLVNKKEKLDFYRKQSLLRSSKYSEGLRSYRNKVLNGIKQRGRPSLLKYQKPTKVEDMPSTSNIENEPETQTVPDDQKHEQVHITEVKLVERRRGRPRKNDPRALKDKKKTGKEVNFIEKHIQKNESDTLPSKRKRKLSAKLQYYRNSSQSEERDEFPSGQVINKSVESVKKCAVCNVTFADNSDFRDHLLTHRIDENAYQCMECGECFVVRPSLEKHLHAFHKIKNIEKYISDNECSNSSKDPSEPLEDKDTEPVKENQCKVCKEQFDRAIDLTKHFRIHGMAFLKEFKKEGKVK